MNIKKEHLYIFYKAKNIYTLFVEHTFLIKYRTCQINFDSEIYIKYISISIIIY